MARMAVEKSSRPEPRALAQSIIDSQQKEVQQMAAYLKDWYGMEPPAGSMEPPEVMAKFDEPILQGLEPDMEARMKALEAKSGADIDIEFMSGMIQHHSLAIMMAAPVLAGGSHEELCTLSENIVISQGEEIRQMDQWLSARYGVKPPFH